jgi:hypothetical protein
MKRRKISLLICLVIMAAVMALSFNKAVAQDAAKKDDVNVTLLDKVLKSKNQVTPSERKAAAKNAAALGLKVPKPPASAPVSAQPSTPEPGKDQDSNQTN